MNASKIALALCAATICAMPPATATPTFNQKSNEDATPVRNINKKEKELNEFQDYSDIYDDVHIPKSYVNHDDSVASRSSGELPIGGDNSGKVPNGTLDPITCEHPAYESLCDDIKKAVGGGGTSPSSDVIYDGHTTGAVFYDPEKYSSVTVTFSIDNANKPDSTQTINYNTSIGTIVQTDTARTYLPDTGQPTVFACSGHLGRGTVSGCHSKDKFPDGYTTIGYGKVFIIKVVGVAIN